MKKEGTVYQYSMILLSFVFSLMSLFIFNSALSAAVEVVEPSVSTFSSPESFEPGYTGDLNISFPLTTVPGRNGLNYNVSLAYNGSGIKALQNASWVGLGWNIPLPQVTCSPSSYQYPHTSPDVPLGWSPKEADEWNDRFFVSYEGTSFEISNFDNTWYPLDRVGVKIEVTNAGNSTSKQIYSKFIITNASGIQYVFDQPLYLSPYDDNTNPDYSGYTHHKEEWWHYCYTKGSYRYSTPDQIAGYWYPYVVKITEIRSEDYVDINENGICDDDDIGNWIRFTYENPRILYGGAKYYQETDYPESIITPTSAVVFHWETRSDPFIIRCGSMQPPEIGSTTYGHPLQRLAAISLVSKITDELVKKYKFYYDYSASGVSGVGNRLVLRSVEEFDSDDNLSLPPYEFLYTQDAESPFNPNFNPNIEIYWQGQDDRSTIDFWGYYRENDIIYSIPGWPDQDETNVTAWTLTQITNPTGGKVAFEYEADEFPWPEGGIHKGGGVRIKKITRDDGLGNASSFVYSYDDCCIPSVPECRFDRIYSHLTGTIVKVSQTGINVNTEVHYGKVTKTFDDNSKTVTRYITADPTTGYEDKNYRYPNSYGEYYEYMAFLIRRIDASWKRGKVTSTTMYTPSGGLDQKDTLIYSVILNDGDRWYIYWYRWGNTYTMPVYLRRGEMRLFERRVLKDNIWSTTRYASYDVDNGLPDEIIYDYGGENIHKIYEFAHDVHNDMKDKNMLTQVNQITKIKDSKVWSRKFTYWGHSYGNYNQWYLAKIRTYISGNSYTDTAFTDYDSYGHVLKIRDPNYNFTYYFYGDNDNNFSNSANGLKHSYLTGMRNLLDESEYLETEIDYEEKFLKPSLVTDFNDEVTTYSYDSFGRIYTIKIPPDFLSTETYIYYHTTGNVYADPNYIKLTKRTVGSNNHVIYSYYDGLGRLFKNEDIYNRPSNILTKIEYDGLGRKYREYQPYFESEGPQVYKEYLYHGPTGRLKEIKLPDADGDGNPEIITFNYLSVDGFRTTFVKNERGKYTRYFYDNLDRLVRIKNHMPGVNNYIYTDYNWNPTGQCTLIVYDSRIGNRNITTKFKYNMIGNEKSRESNDFGLIEKEYDDNGNLIKVQDSNLRPDGRFLHYEYDALNRDTMIWVDTLVQNQNPDTTWKMFDDFEYGIQGWQPDDNTSLTSDNQSFYGNKSMSITRKYNGISECTAKKNFSIVSGDIQYCAIRLWCKGDEVIGGHNVHARLLDAQGELLAGNGIQVLDQWQKLQFNCDNVVNPEDVKKIQIINEQEIGKEIDDVEPANIDAIMKGYILEWEMQKKVLVKKLYDHYPTGINPGGYPKGHLTLVEDTTGSTMYIYDKRGRIKEKRTYITELDDILKVKYEYNSADNLTKIIYPSGKVYYVRRDKMEWVEEVDDNGTNQYVQYNYTPHGYPLVNSFGDQSSDTLNYLPNRALKSIKCISPYYGTIVNREYHYDKCGNRDSLYTFSGTVKLLDASYQYDNLNRLTSEDNVYSGQDFTYQYDNTGNRTHRNSTVYSIENNSNRLLSAGSIDYEYDENGNITKVGSDPNATYITYDHFNKPIKIQEPFKEFSFTYNGLGQRVKKWEGGDVEEYGDMIIEEPLGEPHDDARDLGNLSIVCDSNDITVTVPHRHIYPPGLQRNYEDFYLTINIDGVSSSGNLLYPDSLMTLVPNNAAWEFCIYVKSLNDYGIFDVYGNKHKHPQGMKVSYSGVGSNQSLKITFPSKSINNPNRIRITGLSTMPGYSNGNKSRATDVMGGGSKELKGDTIAGFSEMMVPPPPEYERIYYIYDESDNVIAELDKQGTIKAECLYADGWRLARFEEGKPRYYYHTDQLNNTIAITGRRTGEPTVTKYYAFGDIREEYGDVKDNRYKFTGKELDGTDLYYFGARYYDKSLGRFISIDPVLKIGEETQSLNPYIFCNNNPLRFVDPDGREAEEAAKENNKPKKIKTSWARRITRWVVAIFDALGIETPPNDYVMFNDEPEDDKPLSDYVDLQKIAQSMELIEFAKSLVFTPHAKDELEDPTRLADREDVAKAINEGQTKQGKEPGTIEYYHHDFKRKGMTLHVTVTKKGVVKQFHPMSTKRAKKQILTRKDLEH